MSEIAEEVLKGSRRAVARLISLVENGDPKAREAISTLFKHTGNAHVVGITGPPGSGKSTLISQIIKEIRKREKTVGVVAVDPSSPFTGGALLGDRIRMQGSSGDKGVFIRSMSNRGHQGGLARATVDAIRVLDSSGMDFVIVETVGAGQSEVDVYNAVHTSVVIFPPGTGDEIQVFKAGILEIGTIFVVNKADLEGADRTVTELELMLDLDPRSGKQVWTFPIIKTIAKEGIGVPELISQIDKHLMFLKESGQIHSLEMLRRKKELIKLVNHELTRYVLENAERLVGDLDEIVKMITERKIDPYEATNIVLNPIITGEFKPEKEKA